LVQRVVDVRVRHEVLRKNDVLRVSAANGERIADHAPLRFAPETQYLAKIVNKAGKDKPAGMTILANCLRGLQQMFNLGQVSVWITVIDQRIQELRRLPDTLFPLVQAKVFLLLGYHVVECLKLMVEPVELRYTRGGLLVILTEL